MECKYANKFSQIRQLQQPGNCKSENKEEENFGNGPIQWRKQQYKEHKEPEDENKHNKIKTNKLKIMIYIFSLIALLLLFNRQSYTKLLKLYYVNNLLFR